MTIMGELRAMAVDVLRSMDTRLSRLQRSLFDAETIIEERNRALTEARRAREAQAEACDARDAAEQKCRDMIEAFDADKRKPGRLPYIARGTDPIHSVVVYDSLNLLRDRATQIARDHGFENHEDPERLVATEMIALMHSELSEGLEDLRAGHAITETWYEDREPLPKPCGVASEVADVIIRALHFCGRFDIDIAHAVQEKMRFNESRPHKHGKVF